MKITKTTKSSNRKPIVAPAKRTSASANVSVLIAKPKRETKPLAAAVSTPKPARSATSASVVAVTPEAIARRAYAIWEAQGRPAGKDTEHWLLAEKQLKTTQSFSE